MLRDISLVVLFLVLTTISLPFSSARSKVNEQAVRTPATSAAPFFCATAKKVMLQAALENYCDPIRNFDLYPAEKSDEISYCCIQK